ncbi:hypothetical protein LTR53_016480 [Teratosphaeriaceae sp. CCFEE 6253]|nr:hypothetical protein LTR53_016480 [Teratosphaeriaceae sp. CCFEE 6253]
MFYSKNLLCALGLAALVADAQQVTLGTAGNYAVLAGSTITNTGLTVIGARIGLSPGSSITGFLPGINAGQDIDNAAAVQAKTDLQTAFTALAALPATQDLTGQDLGGKILNAGVYSFSSSGGLTGILTLDGQGNSNAVGSSATLGTATVFAGNVIAQASITVTTGTSLLGGGGFFALTAAVTLDTNAIDPLGACGALVLAPVSSILAPATSTTTTAMSTTVAPTTVVQTTVVPTTVVQTTVVATTDTTTITSTVINPASTTTITVTQAETVTVTQTAATVSTSCTSTTTQWSTKSAYTTAKPSACPKASKRELAPRANHKTKTVVTTCAGHTSTVHKGKAKTSTAKVTFTKTSTVWHTKSATTTKTSTKTPACTVKAKRDYQRLFE